MNKPDGVITRSIMLQTLCVPCSSRCRYCLLSWDGRAPGADYDRSAALAKRMHSRLGEIRPELGFNFSFGYSMEHPRLLDAIDFLSSIGSVTAKFLQMDGMAPRTDAELGELFSSLRAHGVEKVNFTFYGTQAYHDRFAARAGDFELMLRSIRAAVREGLTVSAGMPLTRENNRMAEDVFQMLRGSGVKSEDIRFFIPHGEGRGEKIEPIRLTKREFDALATSIKQLLNRNAYKTEGEWHALALSGGILPEKNRSLIISLTNENIERIENMPPEQLIEWVEGLDEAYYAAFPGFAELVLSYGKSDGEKLFSYRDMFRYYRKLYALEHPVELYDVTDERQTGSRRY